MMGILTHPVFIWAVCLLVVPGIVLWILSYFVASYCTYRATLRRTSKDKWGRELPDDLEEQPRKMYRIGNEWAQKNTQFKREVHIVRDGLNLYGEYYDLGYDKVAIVLSGRTESLKYGYYFAIPYAEHGCNVMVLDPRAHGKLSLIHI